MPWTVADVDKHKKGLSDTQKIRWVAVANSALAACIKKGGTDVTCAGGAVRQANGVVGHSVEYESFYATYKKKQDGAYTVRSQEYQGRTHLIVPVVMMVEGVHNGSHGPLLHTIEDLGKFPQSWNGIPVTIDHPEVEGQNISANAPDVLDARSIGRVFNTRVDGVRLMAEAWLEEERLRQLSSVILAQIQAGESIEVSLGMFTEELQTAGEWNGEQYDAIARNHRPDHLALLPGGRGACSVEDGCGVRANNQKGGNVQVEELFKVLKDMNKEGYSVNNLIADADQGYRELVDSVRQKLDSMDSESSIHFLSEVYDDYVVYEVRMRMGGSRLFKQGYTYNNGIVELQGNPLEVRRKVDYIAMAEGSGQKRTRIIINKNEEEQNMADNAVTCTPCVKKKVDALIAHESKKFAETHREWLETLSEDQLDLLIPTIIEKEVTKEVNVLTATQKAALTYGEKLLKERREDMVKGIQSNTKDIWTDADLVDMDEIKLEKVFNSVKKGKEVVHDYSFVGSNFQTNGSEEEPLPPTGIKFKTVTK